MAGRSLSMKRVSAKAEAAAAAEADKAAAAAADAAGINPLILLFGRPVIITGLFF